MRFNSDFRPAAGLDPQKAVTAGGEAVIGGRDCITLEAFNQRQALAAVVWPYDQTVPVVLSK